MWTLTWAEKVELDRKPETQQYVETLQKSQTLYAPVATWDEDKFGENRYEYLIKPWKRMTPGYPYGRV